MGARGRRDAAQLPKLATLMDTTEEDVLSYMTFPAQHRAKLPSMNPNRGLNGEIKRRTNVVIFGSLLSFRKPSRHHIDSPKVCTPMAINGRTQPG